MGVSTPSIIYEDQKFKIYYGALHNEGYNDVGMAESSSPWITKFTEVRIFNKDLPDYPVQDYDFFLLGGGLSNPEILKSEDYYLLFYDYYENSQYKIGVAYSYDGENWIEYDQNPLILPSGENIHAISPFGFEENKQNKIYYAMTKNENLLFEKIYLKLIFINIPKKSTPTCTSFTYSSWTQCNSSALQSRTITSTNPEDCVGGNSVLVQSCDYDPDISDDEDEERGDVDKVEGERLECAVV